MMMTPRWGKTNDAEMRKERVRTERKLPSRTSRSSEKKFFWKVQQNDWMVAMMVNIARL